MSYCLFQSGPHICAVRRDAVKGVFVSRELAPLPLAPAALEGLAAVRGGVLPVFRLSGLISPESATSLTPRPERILVLEDTGKRFGILVDKIEETPDLKNFTGPHAFEEGELSRRVDRLFAREAA